MGIVLTTLSFVKKKYINNCGGGFCLFFESNVQYDIHIFKYIR